MTESKVAFAEIDWESTAEGVRVKRFEQDGKSIRLLKLSHAMSHPEWCKTGHFGYVVEGDLEIVFENRTDCYSQGDGIFIKSGETEKHIPKPLSDKVILFLIDDV